MPDAAVHQKIDQLLFAINQQISHSRLGVGRRVVSGHLLLQVGGAPHSRRSPSRGRSKVHAVDNGFSFFCFYI
jgi:hypothetical protein